MLPYIIGLTTVGGMRPYFRKHVLNTLEVHDFVFVNSMIISSLVLVYFAYLSIFHNYSLQKTVDRCCSLSLTQTFSLLLLGMFTVFSSLMIFNLEKYFNTPALNFMLLKAFPMIALFIVGVVIFEEVYSISHIVGIGLIIVGILLIFANTANSSK